MTRVNFSYRGHIPQDPEKLALLVEAQAGNTVVRKKAIRELSELAESGQRVGEIEEAEENYMAADDMAAAEALTDLKRLRKEEEKRQIAEYWQKRAVLLKTTGDLTEDEFQTLLELTLPENIGYKQGQIRPDLFLSRYDVYYQFTQAPRRAALRICWIVGLMPFEEEDLLGTSFPEDDDERNFESLLRRHAHARGNDSIARFEEWKEVAEYILDLL